MKFGDVLRGHVALSNAQIEAIWKNADFCLDTNLLLDVYRFTEANRTAFLKLLAAFKGRLFVPHRVALEFARNRIAVIRGHFGPQRLIKSKLDEAAKAIRDKHPKHAHMGDLMAVIEAAKKLVDDKYGSAEKKQMTLIGDDTILNDLLAVTGDDIGDPYPYEDLQKEYKRRKEGMIPPFCKIDDDKDEERRTGDVAIWLELMKRYEGKKKPLVFVTDDLKENWWQDAGGGRRDPQPSLVQEAYIRMEADVLFYSSERFSEVAPAFLGIDIPVGLAEETKEIRQQERESRKEQRRLLGALMLKKAEREGVSQVDINSLKAFLAQSRPVSQGLSMPTLQGLTPAEGLRVQAPLVSFLPPSEAWSPEIQASLREIVRNFSKDEDLNKQSGDAESE